MAKIKSDALRVVSIDGELAHVPVGAHLVDLLPSTVTGVTAINPVSGRNHLISREQFRQAVPLDFLTHLTPIAKGAGSR